ncbi:MAG: hypothetical protein PUC21_10065 [Bacteroidales bacterium]|nr:hypothetical protein [Bacteroidales bacterium]
MFFAFLLALYRYIAVVVVADVAAAILKHFPKPMDAAVGAASHN